MENPFLMVMTQMEEIAQKNGQSEYLSKVSEKCKSWCEQDTYINQKEEIKNMT